jgi:hypothetical protein
MPTFPDHNEAHVLKFTETVQHLSQQMESRFAGKVEEKMCTGEQAQAVIQLTEGDMGSLAAPTAGGGSYDGWMGDTAWDSIEHLQRWITPSAYKRALPIHSKDLSQMLTDPRSQYAQNIVASYNRRKDDTLIAAAIGNATTGRFDNQAATALPGTQIVSVGDTTDGLTVTKLLDTWEKLKAAETNMDEELYFVTSALGLRQLLDSTEIKSSDYNTVKALAAGEINSFMGFNFIHTERNLGGTGFRSDFAYAKSGLCLGKWQDIDIRVDERADKNYTWQIYGSCFHGAVRTEEVKVVQIDCKDVSYT